MTSTNQIDTTATAPTPRSILIDWQCRVGDDGQETADWVIYIDGKLTSAGHSDPPAKPAPVVVPPSPSWAVNTITADYLGDAGAFYKSDVIDAAGAEVYVSQFVTDDDATEPVEIIVQQAAGMPTIASGAAVFNPQQARAVAAALVRFADQVDACGANVSP